MEAPTVMRSTSRPTPVAVISNWSLDKIVPDIATTEMLKRMLSAILSSRETYCDLASCLIKNVPLSRTFLPGKSIETMAYPGAKYIEKKAMIDRTGDSRFS
jgi:hypothetical protein